VRAVFAVILLTGCDLIFTVSPRDVDAAVGVDARFADAPIIDPGAPMFDSITTLPMTVLTDEGMSVTATVHGDMNRQAFIAFSATSGMLDTTQPLPVQLDATGQGFATINFTTPSRFESVSIVARTAYDLDFAVQNTAPITIDVDENFGHTDAFDTTQNLAPLAILATRVTVGNVPGHLARVGIVAAGQRVRFALYSDTDDHPDALQTLPDPPTAPLPGMVGAVEFDATQQLVAGKLWIAIQVNATTTIDAIGAPETPEAILVSTGTPKFTDPLPATFPANSGGNSLGWGVYIRVSP
jgi:hypothetical protein